MQVRLQSPFLPRRVPNNPMMVAGIPETSNQIAFFVGAPVKNRETSEINDSEALTPHMIKMIPAASSATESPLFIAKVTFCYTGCFVFIRCLFQS